MNPKIIENLIASCKEKSSFYIAKNGKFEKLFCKHLIVNLSIVAVVLGLKDNNQLVSCEALYYRQSTKDLYQLINEKCNEKICSSEEDEPHRIIFYGKESDANNIKDEFKKKSTTCIEKRTLRGNDTRSSVLDDSILVSSSEISSAIRSLERRVSDEFSGLKKMIEDLKSKLNDHQSCQEIDMTQSESSINVARNLMDRARRALTIKRANKEWQLKVKNEIAKIESISCDQKQNIIRILLGGGVKATNHPTRFVNQIGLTVFGSEKLETHILGIDGEVVRNPRTRLGDRSKAFSKEEEDLLKSEFNSCHELF